MRRPLRTLLLLATATLAGCTGRPAPVAIVVAPPPVAVAAPTAPAIAYVPGLAIPPRLPDGRYATPNAQPSDAAAVWHLRAGLNVAALACRDADEAALVAAYNALIRTHAASFDRAYRALGAEHGGNAGFDAAMTRLYNFYALPPAHAGLCTAARAVLAEAAALPPGALDGFARAALAKLDQPYQALFAAQDGWTALRLAARAPASALPTLLVDRSVLSQP